MTASTPKKYQQDPAGDGGVLDSVEAYFKACHQNGRASLAFTTCRFVMVKDRQWEQIDRHLTGTEHASKSPE